MSILRNIPGAWSLFVSQVRYHLGEPVAPDSAPEYALRCQHCDAPIRVLAPGSTMFISKEGGLLCDERTRITHHPMPSVLG